MADRVYEIDLQRIEERQKYDVPRADGAKSIYTPIGCPVNISLFQRSNFGPLHKGMSTDLDIEGFTLEESWYIFGVTFYTKYQRKERTLSLWIDDGDGPRKVEEWQR